MMTVGIACPSCSPAPHNDSWTICRVTRSRIQKPYYLLYLSSRELADGLWKKQGEDAIELWKGTDGAILAPPAVSRDGQQIAIATLTDGRAGLHVMTADGANRRRLAPSLNVRLIKQERTST